MKHSKKTFASGGVLACSNAQDQTQYIPDLEHLYCYFVDSKIGDEERLLANLYEPKPMKEAVFMPSKKSIVAIKMLLTATREQLSFILIHTRNCLDIWSHHKQYTLQNQNKKRSKAASGLIESSTLREYN